MFSYECMKNVKDDRISSIFRGNIIKYIIILVTAFGEENPDHTTIHLYINYKQLYYSGFIKVKMLEGNSQNLRKDGDVCFFRWSSWEQV